MIDYFTSEPVTKRVTAIRSRSGEILYLVEGDKRAILIDACVGVVGLRRFVGSLTSKPVTVLLTHGHVDHAMGAPEFDEVWLHRLDRPVYDEMSPLAVRREYIAMSCPPGSPEVGADELVPPHPVAFHELGDGMVFDAGGITVEAIHFPGHTPGMTAMLITETAPANSASTEAILVVGDGCNPRTFLFDHNASSVEEYRDALSRLVERTRGRVGHIVISHHVMRMPDDLFDDALATCDRVLSGISDEVPFDFMGHRAVLAKATGEDGLPADGSMFNLAYDPARLRAAAR